MYKELLETLPAISLPSPLLGAIHATPSLHRLLFGGHQGLDELPPLSDLLAGVLALCEGSRSRVLLPLAGQAAEFALVRDHDHLVVDCYGTESVPELWVRHHRVRLSDLLHACHKAALDTAQRMGQGTLSSVLLQLAVRMERATIRPQRLSLRHVTCTGGSLESPGAGAQLAFGFAAHIGRLPGARPSSRDFADVHALLFEGELWTFAGDHRVNLMRGPIVLAAQRMAAAMRLLLEAWQADRNMSARLRSGAFAIDVRLTGGLADVELTAEDGRKIALRRLSVPDAVLPVLRLCADLLRKLVAVDRGQMRNLRVVNLRHEVRALRRIVRARERRDGFENRDPERLKMSGAPVERHAPAPSHHSLAGRLRYTERWSAEVEALDASNIFLCGDRLILCTAKLTLALDRESGQVLWSAPGDRVQALMVGRVLLTVSSEGVLRVVDVRDGQEHAGGHLPGRPSGALTGLFGGGSNLPPTAIVSDGHRYLWCVDLRTGELRYRYRCRGASGIQLRRAGRVLLVTCGDGSVDALDIGTGEAVWRHSADERFCLAPTVVGQVVVASSGEPGGGQGKLHGIDLFSGRRLWQRDLPAAPGVAPQATADTVIVPCGGSRSAQLLAVSPGDGQIRFACHDPGLDNGGRALEVDGQFIINTPRGRVVSLDLQDGHTRWSQALSNPLTDDVPRGLSPLLRQGALFVPSAQVHILRPADGASLVSSMPCDLVPDFLQVDERGHLYVAEESGHLRAYAPGPHLTLVT